MHVLFDARLLHRPLSGIERVQKNVLTALAQLPAVARLRVVVQRGTRLPEDLPGRVEIVQVDASEQILALLLHEDASERPDVYHLTFFPDRSPKDIWLPIAAHASVVEVHDAILNRHPEYHIDARAHTAYDAFVKRLARSGDRLLAHSESVRREIERDLGGDPSRVDIAPLAVDPRLLRPPAAGADAGRLASLGVFGRFFLAVGKDYPHKDHATLFRALARVPGAQLVCAGSRVSLGHSDELAQTLGIVERVRWLEYVEDVDLAALLRGSEALVYPSREEGFGMPPIEAMALGTLVIAANATAIPEVCGDGAWLFPPGDEQRLAELMHKALTGGAEKAQQIARGTARAQRFSWQQCAQATLRCYERALAAARTTPRCRTVLDADMAAVLRTVATSPFNDGVLIEEWKKRFAAVEEHARMQDAGLARLQPHLLGLEQKIAAVEPHMAALEKYRDHLLWQVEELKRAHAGRPRWSFKRMLGKLKGTRAKRST